MNDTLELPAIDEAMIDTPAPTTAVATAAAQAVDAAKAPDLQQIALAQFGDWRAGVQAVKTKLAGLVHDLSTQTKVDDAKTLRWRLIGQPRAEARKTAKDLKSKLAKVSKAIGAEEEAIVAGYDDAETLITPQIEAREAELEAERAKERERIAALDAKLAALSTWIERCKEPGMTAERIEKGIALLEDAQIDPDEWQEYAARAEDRKAEVLGVMHTLYDQAVRREAEAARLEAQRLENERIAAELAAQRAEIERQAAVLRQQEQEIEAARQRADAAGRSADLGTGATPAPGQRETPPITQDAQESGSSPADEPAPVDAPGMCASSTAESAEAVPSGDEGTAAHADSSAAEPVHINTEDQPALVPSSGGATQSTIHLCWDLLQVLKAPYGGRYPSHPKPGPEWWADVRSRIEALEPRLAKMVGAN